MHAATAPRRPTASPVWWHRPSPPAPASRLLEVCSGNTVLAALLQARGVGAEDAVALLGLTTPPPGDPFLLTGMEDAVSCLQAAAWAGQPCVVFGDYDC